MRTVINWPDAYDTMSGMDRFCGGPEHEDRTAMAFYYEAKPIVEKAVENLEAQIDKLQLQVNELKAAKPKLRYHSDLGIWYVVPKESK